MGATSILLILMAVLLLALFWRIGRNLARPDSPDDPVDPDEADLIEKQIHVARRLRREAAETDDPVEKASLIRLADEADGDAEKLFRDVEGGPASAAARQMPAAGKPRRR